MVVVINRPPKADDKNGNISYEDLRKSTNMHQKDVKSMLYLLARKMMQIGDAHDWSKDDRQLQYYNDYIKSKKTGKDMHKMDWYKYHFDHERHHLEDDIPENVNLLDVIEFIADACCDGIAEDGKPESMEISDKVLRTAFLNTIKLVKDNIYLNEPNKN